MLALLRFLAFAFSFTALVAQAQSTWSAVTNPSRHSLWGVCFGGGQFVAVGENGTILTSPDGLAWTARTSGTTAWLTSVDYGLGSYFAVGERGTVLRSHDGIAWEDFPSRFTRRPSVRLNVVRFNPTGFLVYGEQNSALRVDYPARLDWYSDILRPAGPWWRTVATGLDRTLVGGETGIIALPLGSELSPGTTSAVQVADARNISGLVFQRDTFTAVGAAGAIISSNDVTHWTREPSGTTENLHGLAAFNNRLIAVDAAGTILTQESPAQWQRRATPTTEMLFAVAADDSAAVVVGGNGTILRATASLVAPTILAPPTAVTETLGGAASFLVRAGGSLPLSYQWLRNGVALPGETRDTLIRTPLAAVDAGNYTVTVSNAAGSVTSPAAALSLLPAPAAVVDASFIADARLDGSVTALLPLADGSVLVATTSALRSDAIPCRVRKLRPDGTLDPAWAENNFGASDPQFFPSIQRLVPQPDGAILVGGTFLTHNGVPRRHLVRLTAAGVFDPTFVPNDEATARPITELALHRGNRILVANAGTVPLRLLPTGELDPAFAPAPLPTVEIPSRPGSFRDRFVRTFSVAGDHVYFGGTANLQITLVQGFVPDSMLVRLDGTGAIDPTFARQQWTGDLLGLRALEDQSLLVLRDSRRAGVGFPVDAQIVRLSSDGSSFPGHLAPTVQRFGPAYIYPDGRVLYFAFNQPSPVRLTALGAPDETFTGGIGTPSVLTATADGRVLVGGNFTVYDGAAANRVARLNSVPNQTVNAPRLLTLAADRLALAIGETTQVRAAVTGSAALTYDWIVENGAATRTTSPTFTFAPRNYGAGATTLKLIVRNPRGEATSSTLTFAILPNTPAITAQPSRIATQTGRTVTLRIERDPDAGPLAVEWRRNGQLLPRPGEPWEDGQTLRLAAVTVTDAGTYTLTLRNKLGNIVTSAPILVSVDTTSRFANLSTRAHVSPGNPVIAGFSFTGQTNRQMLLRGVGRGLAQFGVTDPLPDPQIFVYQGATALNAGNLDWDNTSPEIIATLSAAFARAGAFPLERGSRDSAQLACLAPGNYTVHLTDSAGDSGTALVEIYEGDNESAPPRNLSTRATVTPAAPTIAGFSIVGPVPKRVLLRAAGPALAGFGVSSALANPRLELRDATGQIVASNDDWDTAPTLAELTASTQAAGAFPFSAGSRDAALLVTLPPGNYTAIAATADSSTGAALVEIYEVPDIR